MQIRRHFQGTFKSIPFSGPVRSPSPDRSNSNVITPTASPDYLQITQHLTPPKSSQLYKSGNRSYQTTELKKYGSYHTPIAQVDYINSTNDKDDLINQLRKIISLMKARNYQNQDTREIKQLKDQIKILIIQNQKLLSLIDKIKSQKNNNNQYYQQFKQINFISASDKTNVKNMDSLIKSHKNLTQYCKQIQNQLKNLQKQNQKLIKLLKQKDQSQRKLYLEKIQSNQQHKMQKLSITKIKQQYQQSINLAKKQFQQRIQFTMDNYNRVIADLNQKMNIIQSRIKQISIKQNIQKKPQIYIEEGPQSSNQIQKNKDEDLGQMIEQSRKDLQQLKNNQQKIQFQTTYIKYEKTNLDSTITEYSKKISSYQDTISKYSYTLQLKDNQITALRNQLQEKNNQKLKFINFNQVELRSKIKSLEQEISKVINSKEEQISLLKYQTQLKVKQLIDFHQEQLQLLKSQLISKNQYIYQINNNNSKKQLQIDQQITTLKNFSSHLQLQYQAQKNQLQEKIIKNQIIINQVNQKSYQLQLENNSLKQNYQRQKLNLYNSINYKNLEIQKMDSQIKKLTFEPEQLKRKIKQLTQLLSKTQTQLLSKTQQMRNIIQFKNQEIQKNKKDYYNSYKLLQNQNQKLKGALEKYKKQISSILEKISRFKFSNMIQQLIQVKKMIDVDKIVKLECEFGQISQLYEKISIILQQKIKQVEQVRKQNIGWSDKYIKWEENRSGLEQKVRYQQQVIQVYKKQLEDRKKLNQKFIQQQSSLQKQLLGLKREQIKISSSNQSVKNATSFFQKIDKMIAIEKERIRQCQICVTQTTILNI